MRGINSMGNKKEERHGHGHGDMKWTCRMRQIGTKRSQYS